MSTHPTPSLSRGVLGLHHVTALAKDPGENLRFYTRVLGLRLVKKTVNFDDPGSYHFYFGDRLGRPGTLMTFFPHPHAAHGREGAPEVATTLFAVPPGALGWWRDRLSAESIDLRPETAFGQERLAFRDPDGTRLALVEAEDARGAAPHEGSEIPADRAITGIDSVVLALRGREPTERLLVDALGYRLAETDGARHRYVLGTGSGPGERLEVLVDPSLPERRLGAGSVHHVAFRVADDAAQERIAATVGPIAGGVTEQRDRNYFRSIYFREPGGVIFEIATDIPGFMTDEAEEELGTHLRLPPQFEHARERIEAALPPLPGGPSLEAA